MVWLGRLGTCLMQQPTLGAWTKYSVWAAYNMLLGTHQVSVKLPWLISFELFFQILSKLSQSRVPQARGLG